MNRKPYPYIQAWHALTGSRAYYWKKLQEQAREDDAPDNATYRGQDGRWHTIEECQNPDMAERCHKYVEGMK